MPKTAVLVDGGFFLRRARHQWKDASGVERADQLISYVGYHIKRNNRGRLEGGKRSLYRANDMSILDSTTHDAVRI